MKADRVQLVVEELFKLGVSDFGLEVYLPPYFTEEKVQAIHQRLKECGLEAVNEDGGLFEIREQGDA